MDRLITLVFSFYREETMIIDFLKPLMATKMSRGMGTIYIECSDSIQLRLVIPLIKYLIVPIGLLKLGRNIVIYSSDSPALRYSKMVEFDKNLYV